MVGLYKQSSSSHPFPVGPLVSTIGSLFSSIASLVSSMSIVMFKIVKLKVSGPEVTFSVVFVPAGGLVGGGGGCTPGDDSTCPARGLIQ